MQMLYETTVPNNKLMNKKKYRLKREGSFQEPQNWLQLINFIAN